MMIVEWLKHVLLQTESCRPFFKNNIFSEFNFLFSLVQYSLSIIQDKGEKWNWFQLKTFYTEKILNHNMFIQQFWKITK